MGSKKEKETVNNSVLDLLIQAGSLIERARYQIAAEMVDRTLERGDRHTHILSFTEAVLILLKRCIDWLV